MHLYLRPQTPDWALQRALLRRVVTAARKRQVQAPRRFIGRPRVHCFFGIAALGFLFWLVAAVVPILVWLWRVL